MQAWRAVERGDDGIAALLKGCAALGHDALRAGERLDRRGLAHRRRARGRLALHHGHRGDQRARSRAVADAPASHRIGLRHAVHGERAFAQARLHRHRRCEREAVVEDVLVDVVREHPDVGVVEQHVGDRFQLRRAVGRTARVRRRVEKEPARARRDGRLQLRRGQAKAVLLAARHRHRHAAADLHDVGVRGPVRRRQDHLVARVQARHQRIEDHLLGARAHADLVECEVQRVVALELQLHRRLHRRAAVEHRVARVATRNGLRGRMPDVLGRVEVGLARAQHDHRAAGALERLRVIGDAQDLRDLDGAHALRRREHGGVCHLA
ncbi:hypothetical protein FQZ97_666800 [compost metagenome]